MLSSANHGSVGPGVERKGPFADGVVCGQLGHIARGRGLRDVEPFTELPSLFKVFSCQCTMSMTLFLFPICL